MSVSTRINPTKPCGCRNHCGCASAQGELANSSGFVRPRFFAGQLLTDEDLQATLDYIVQKNRLYNRNLFGDGVVCGLQVQRHPCADQQRRVIVRAGHALDCCGNDLIIPCDTEIDVARKVHELRAKSIGSDCGDPCDGSVVNNESCNISYDLFIRYKESFSDPVTPYQIDGNNGPGCETSRVREGYCFELRRAIDSPEPVDLRAKLDACKSTIPKYRHYQRNVLHGLSTLTMAEKVLVQCDSVTHSIVVPANKAKLLQSLSDQEVNTVAGSVAQVIKEINEAHTEDPPKISVAEQRSLANSIHGALTLAFRAIYTSADLPLNSGAVEIIKRIQLLLAPALPWLQGVQSTSTAASDDQTPVPSSVVSLLVTRNDHLSQIITVGEPAETFDGKATIVGELIGQQIVADSISRLNSVNDELRGLVIGGLLSIEPDLLDSMNNLRLAELASAPALLSLSLATPETLAGITQQAEVVGRAIAEISRQCLCDIVLPPCPPCDDTAVLLARIVVRGCNVVDTCNLQRKLVLTGPSLRYWFNEFRSILTPLRNACCPSKATIDDAEHAAAKSHDEAIQRWKSEVGNPTETLSVPGIAEHIDNPAAWTNLDARSDARPDINELGLAAVEPPSAKLFDPLSDTASGSLAYIGLSEQALNLGIATLAGRPATDIRDILDRSDELESNSTVKRIALTEIGSLKDLLQPAIETATRDSSHAVQKANEATLAVGILKQQVLDASDVTQDPLKTIKDDIQVNKSDIARALDVTQDPLKTIKDDIQVNKSDIARALDVTRDPLKTIKDDIQVNKSDIARALDVTQDPLKTIKDDIQSCNTSINNKVNSATFTALKEHYRNHLATEHPPKDNGAP